MPPPDCATKSHSHWRPSMPAAPADPSAVVESSKTQHANRCADDRQRAPHAAPISRVFSGSVRRRFLHFCISAFAFQIDTPAPPPPPPTPRDCSSSPSPTPITPAAAIRKPPAANASKFDVRCSMFHVRRTPHSALLDFGLWTLDIGLRAHRQDYPDAHQHPKRIRIVPRPGPPRLAPVLETSPSPPATPPPPAAE